jgi:hypothetical protein
LQFELDFKQQSCELRFFIEECIIKQTLDEQQ